MNFKESNYEILSTHDFDIEKRLEMIGRVCYKSEDKITENSYKEFIEKILINKHLSVLEHANFVFNFKDDNLFDLLKIENFKFFNFTIYEKKLVSCNLRALYEAYLCYLSRPHEYHILNILKVMIKKIKHLVPAMFSRYGFDEELEISRFDDKIELISDLAELYQLEREKHIYFTCKIMCDRGISHELVRHRIASFTQESTRYCNYKSKSLNFIDITKAYEYDSSIQNLSQEKKDAINLIFAETCNMLDYQYNTLIEIGASPQFARSILPNMLKTELYMTCNIEEWRHIFELRTASGAHPQMKELMVPLQNDMEKWFEEGGKHDDEKK